jgi:hypothetical protein
LLASIFCGATDAHYQKGTVMKEEAKKIYQTIANTIHFLFMDAFFSK